MLYLVIEHFVNGDAAPVYRRFQTDGRMMPDGLKYVASWVEADLGRCYQVVECDHPSLLEDWMKHWRDIVEFEVVPVITSSEAAAQILPQL